MTEKERDQNEERMNATIFSTNRFYLHLSDQLKHYFCETGNGGSTYINRQ